MSCTFTEIYILFLSLNAHSWTPPNWMFPIAWTSLYTAMGVASYLVYQTGYDKLVDTNTALSWYAVQVVFYVLFREFLNKVLGNE